jgi:ECF transporter S component (folate family)
MSLLINVSKVFRIQKLGVSDMSIIAILIAMMYVLGQIGMRGTYIAFTLAFVATAILSTMYGPIIAGFIAGLTDILFTFISGMTYIPAFTVSAILGAFIYGVFFYQNNFSIARVVIAQFVVAIFVNTILNTLWLALFMPHLTLNIILWPRLIKEIVTTPIQMMILVFILGNPVIRRVIEQRWR